MKVSFLVPDMASPSVGAAVRLAQALQGYAESEIVGPDLGHGVVSMYRASFDFKAIPCPRLYRLPDFWWQSRRLERAVTGDVVVALKAYRNTVPLALRLKRKKGITAAVFLDEWDGAVLADLSPAQRRRRAIRQWYHPLEDTHYAAVEARIPELDAVLSTTTFLQRKFGGHVIAFGADTNRFRPQPADAVLELRKRLGLSGKRLIVFGGVVRPHKGVELITEALARLNDDSIRLLVVGPVTEHLADMQRDARQGRWICVAGAAFPDSEGINQAIHEEMPLYLDLADLIVLPLLNTPLAESQMPIKVFEAMAMAKPVIASRVSDMESLLVNCGLTIPPNDATALAEALKLLFQDVPRRQAMGAAARERAIRDFDLRLVGRRLFEILRDA